MCEKLYVVYVYVCVWYVYVYDTYIRTRVDEKARIWISIEIYEMTAN